MVFVGLVEGNEKYQATVGTNHSIHGGYAGTRSWHYRLFQKARMFVGAVVSGMRRVKARLPFLMQRSARNQRVTALERIRHDCAGP